MKIRKKLVVCFIIFIMTPSISIINIQSQSDTGLYLYARDMQHVDGEKSEISDTAIYGEKVVGIGD